MDGDLEGGGEAAERLQRRVCDALLDMGVVSDLHANALGERFLRETTRPPQLAQAYAEVSGERRIAESHGMEIARPAPTKQSNI